MKRRITGFRALIIILITVLLFQGCNKLPPIDDGTDSDISSVETTYKSEIFDTLGNYFSKYQSETSYIIVKSYIVLCDIYEFARIGPEWSSIFYIQGSVRNDYINNMYPEEYFERGYIIAVLTTTTSGSYTFECSATKNDGEIIVNLDGTLPMPFTCDIGGYIHLVPIDGAYANERVKIVSTYTELESYPAAQTTSSAETTTH